MNTKGLIYKVVNRYIGVSGGYLGLPINKRFTYKSHAEFYPEFCDLVVNTTEYEGTTRESFINIFLDSEPKDQAKIIKGVIEKFPINEGPKTRNKKLKDELLAEAAKLENMHYVSGVNIEKSSDSVLEALKDAENLINNRKPVSAVDRAHTALHGYLRYICESRSLEYSKEDSMTSLVKVIYREIPEFHSSLKETENIIKGLSTILSSLNPIRNNASLAHPNEKLLNDEEATLVINSVRTILIYFSSKFKKGD